MLILLVLTIILSNVIFSKKEKVILDEVKLKNIVNKNMFAMYYETKQEDGTYTYVESEDTAWPVNLRFNAKKSGCIDGDGNKIEEEILTYDDETHIATVDTGITAYCYLYFDLGTEEKPYKIQYIEDLVDLSNKVNDGDTYNNAYFILERDLDFTKPDSYKKYDRTDYGDINGVGGIEPLMTELTNTSGTGFIPIGYATGSENISFNGTFDGNEKTISNLYIKNNTASKSVGLFGKINNSIIKNLKLTGNVITTENANMGGIVGRVYGDSTIQNIEGTVNMESEVTTGSTGGIIGSTSDANGTYILKDLINRGSITEGRNNGGIIGWVMDKKMTIENCQNYGTIKNGERVGGIVGGTDNSSVLVEINNSHNNAQINIEKGVSVLDVGGLAGTIQSSTSKIEESFNHGTITSNIGGNIGGLIGGDYTNSSNTTISKSHNYGQIKIENNEATTASYVGGLMGRSYGNLTIEESSNEIKTTNDEAGINVIYHGTSEIAVGGLIGYGLTQTKTISKSYNTSNIVVQSETTSGGGTNVGGIIGISKAITTITNSSNEIATTGDEKGIIVINNSSNETNVGGIIGYNTNAVVKIENSYNTSDVYGGVRTGGIVGLSNNTKLIINKCYNTGNLTGQEDTKYTLSVVIGGIVSYTWENSVSYILNSYNTGTLTAKATNTENYISGLGMVSNNENASTSIILNSCNLGNMISKDNGIGINNIGSTSNIKTNNVYNAGNIEGTTKYSVVRNYSTGTVDIQNTYYKEVSGIEESNKGDILGAYPITDANMKNTNGNDTNSLLYKLNTNVQTLNNQGLTTYSEDLKDYTLVDWIIDPTTGYPTLNFKLEGNE